MHQKTCKVHGELAQKDIVIVKSAKIKCGYSLRCRLCKLNAAKVHREKQDAYKPSAIDLLWKVPPHNITQTQ